MDEIKRRLGYRFTLLEATLQDSIKPGSTFELSFTSVNSGFASPYNPKNTEIILRNSQTKERYFLIVNADPRFWMAGDTTWVTIRAGIPIDIQTGNYEILLHLADSHPVIHDRPEYAIRFANSDVWEDSTGYNSLLHEMVIDLNAPGDMYSGDSLFKPINDHPTGITPKTRYQPQNFKLEGNYPNPFNGSTVIKFSLMEHSDVRLDIINIKGELVDRIAEKGYGSGRHRVLWQPENLSSGAYFYRLSVDGISQVGKTLYIK
jgi:hypothetical protein